MPNKYQEELDKLKAWCYLYPETKLIKDRFNHSFDTLQELIDRQADYVGYQDVKSEYEEKIARLNVSYANCCIERLKLEKALDKMCYERRLEDYDFCEDCKVYAYGVDYDTCVGCIKEHYLESCEQK